MIVVGVFVWLVVVVVVFVVFGFVSWCLVIVVGLVIGLFGMIIFVW